MSAVNLQSILAQARQTAEEHEKRMAEDPVYRAETEASEAADRKRVESFRGWEATQVAARVAARRQSQGIPERVIRFIESASENDATRATDAFMESDKTLLLLLGGEGNGKTAAACIALDRAGQGRMVKAGAIVRAGSFDDAGFKELARAQTLVIDDLGMEPLDEKGWASSLIAQLLDARYDACKKTILTSNLTPDQFAARYLDSDGGRLRGRFREVGTIITLGGPSLRVSK